VVCCALVVQLVKVKIVSPKSVALKFIFIIYFLLFLCRSTMRHNAPEALRSVLPFAKPSDVRSPWKGLGRQSLRGDVTEARRDFVTSVKYKRSAGLEALHFQFNDMFVNIHFV